jgi:hypothetical protein
MPPASRLDKSRNCFTWAWRKWRIEGGFIAFAIAEGWPRFYWCASIEGEYRRPIYRYRIPWNIFWHKGRVERQSGAP